MEPYKVDFKSTGWETPAVGVRFKVHKQDGKQLRLVEFTNEFIEPDWCAKGHVGYILEGQLEVDFDGKVVIFNSGDGLFIPAGEEHKHIARVLTDVVKLILVEDI
ncbi:cupin domain-containing protein [bacterium]|nr:cupin domain-containing protein [bacterium]